LLLTVVFKFSGLLSIHYARLPSVQKLDVKQLKGPKTPALLQTIQWLVDPERFLDHCQQQYGELFTTRFIFAKQGATISDPKAVQLMMTTLADRFDSGVVSQMVMPLLGPASILLLDGEPHRRQRRLLLPPFHGERMRAYGNLIVEITEKAIDRWQVGDTVAILPAMQEISLESILKAVFGVTDETQFQTLKQRIIDLLNFLSSPLSGGVLFIPFLQHDWGRWSPWKRFLNYRQKVDEILYAEIDRRRCHPNPNQTDVLSLMMEACDEEGQTMSDQELRDELMTLLFAGHETTASSLTWAIYSIHRFPDIEAKLRAELAQLPQVAAPLEIAQLPYLSAVCQETLRLYPVTIYTFARVAREPFDLMGYHIEAGTLLVPCIYLTHQRSDLYPEPKRFRPERFLERHFSPYEYYPFGGGNRRCVGMAFAQYEMRLVLATLLRRMQLKLENQRPMKQVSRGLTFGPSGKLPMLVCSKS
jgi:cytochrome P450